MKGKIISILVITGLLLCAFSTTISTANKHQQSQSIDEIEARQQTLSTEAFVSCTLYGYDNEDIIQNQQISREEAVYLLSLLQIYQTLQKNGDTINALKTQEELLSFAEEKNLMPEGFSSSFSPPRIFTLLEPLMSRGTTQTQRTGSEWLCNLVSFGEGSAVPIIVLPRLVPIILLPIPRVFMKWSAQQGYTSVGGLSSHTGFLAEGEHDGVAWGFWGVGFSIFLPPIMNYGLFGYSLFTRVNAENIEYYPPNNPPHITNPSPTNQIDMVPLSTSHLEFSLSDEDGELMEYWVETSPNIGSQHQQNVNNGTYNVPLSNLDSGTTYSWTIIVEDSRDRIEQTYEFTTIGDSPYIFDELPVEMSGVSIELDSVSFELFEPQGQLMSCTVETSPDIGSKTFTNIADGRYSVSVDGLVENRWYSWYVNVTDGVHETKEEFTFYSGYNALVALWSFDEGQGLIAHDSSQNSNDGELNGANWAPESIKGYSMYFGGSSNRVEVADHSSLNFADTNEFSISMWIKRGDVNTGQSGKLISKSQTGTGKGYSLHVYRNDTINLRCRTGSECFDIFSNQKILDTSWHHIVTIWDKGIQKIYIDGNLDCVVDNGLKYIKDEPKTLELGVQNAGASNPYCGYMDEIYIFERAITDLEIHNLFEQR